jgi:hypothetical protein
MTVDVEEQPILFGSASGTSRTAWSLASIGTRRPNKSGEVDQGRVFQPRRRDVLSRDSIPDKIVDLLPARGPFGHFQHARIGIQRTQRRPAVLRISQSDAAKQLRVWR